MCSPTRLPCPCPRNCEPARRASLALLVHNLSFKEIHMSGSCIPSRSSRTCTKAYLRAIKTWGALPQTNHIDPCLPDAEDQHVQGAACTLVVQWIVLSTSRISTHLILKSHVTIIPPLCPSARLLNPPTRPAQQASIAGRLANRGARRHKTALRTSPNRISRQSDQATAPRPR